MKKVFILGVALMSATLLVAQSVLTDTTFLDLYSGLMVVVSTALTYVAKNQIVKGVDDNFVQKILKNTWVLSGIVFAVVAFVFVKFGLTAANALLAAKFIGSNLLAVIWSALQTPKLPAGEAISSPK